MIFCLSCKKHTNDIIPIGKLTKNNRPYISTKCNICKRMKSKFVSVKEINGSGFYQTYLKYSSIKHHFLKIIIIIFIFYKMGIFKIIFFSNISIMSSFKLIIFLFINIGL